MKLTLKELQNVCNTSMAILGTLFVVIAILAYVGGTVASGALQSLSEEASRFMGGLSLCWWNDAFRRFRPYC